MSMWNEISRIRSNDAIFLFKRSRNHPMIYGVFLPDGAPKRNIEVSAWGGKYPAQISVKQYFKFCPLPLHTFKKIFEGNDGAKTSLRINTEQTLDLITKFIIHTRLVLGYCVLSRLSGMVGKNICPYWVKEKWMLLHNSSNWYTELIARDRLGFRFVPQYMLQGGTMQDFMSAIRSITVRGYLNESKTVISEDWRYFMKIISDLSALSNYLDGPSNRIDDFISIISQSSLPVWLDIGSPALQSSHAADVKKWFGFASSGRSSGKKLHTRV